MSTKTADRIVPGDVLLVHGELIHEDLAGLKFDVPVDAVSCNLRRKIVVHSHDIDGAATTIWFFPGEEVALATA